MCVWHRLVKLDALKCGKVGSGNFVIKAAVNQLIVVVRNTLGNIWLVQLICSENSDRVIFVKSALASASLLLLFLLLLLLMLLLLLLMMLLLLLLMILLLMLFAIVCCCCYCCWCCGCCSCCCCCCWCCCYCALNLSFFYVLSFCDRKRKRRRTVRRRMCTVKKYNNPWVQPVWPDWAIFKSSWQQISL